jgi:hypothetical protein
VLVFAAISRPTMRTVRDNRHPPPLSLMIHRGTRTLLEAKGRGHEQRNNVPGRSTRKEAKCTRSRIWCKGWRLRILRGDDGRTSAIQIYIERLRNECVPGLSPDLSLYLTWAHLPGVGKSGVEELRGKRVESCPITIVRFT